MIMGANVFIASKSYRAVSFFRISLQSDLLVENKLKKEDIFSVLYVTFHFYGSLEIRFHFEGN